MKVRVATDNRNQVLQARNTTIDVEVRNLGLLEDLSNLRTNWDAILSEAKTVATVMDIDPKFVTAHIKKRKRFHDERIDEIPGTSSEQILTADNVFKIHIFDAPKNSVILNLTSRFEAAKSLNSTIAFLWNYVNLTDKQVESKLQCIYELVQR